MIDRPEVTIPLPTAAEVVGRHCFDADVLLSALLEDVDAYIVAEAIIERNLHAIGIKVWDTKPLLRVVRAATDLMGSGGMDTFTDPADKAVSELVDALAAYYEAEDVPR